MPTPIRITLIGAHGRMGRAIAAAAQLDPAVRLGALVVRAGSPALGGKSPVAGLDYTDDLAAALAGADVAIEFAGPAAAGAVAEACAARGVALVAGSTGLDAAAGAAREAAATRIALLAAANFAPGVVVLGHLAAQAARALPGFEVAIEETHHVHKLDSPSGTALRLAEALRGAGAEPRITAHRVGEVIGEHSVSLSSPGERLTLSHHAAHRSLFAHGALVAAKWLAGRPAGRYAMEDALGLK